VSAVRYFGELEVGWRFWWPETEPLAAPTSSWGADSKREILASLAPVLTPDAVLCNDGSSAMATAASALGIEHTP
jgi:hypothetical protein